MAELETRYSAASSLASCSVEEYLTEVIDEVDPSFHVGINNEHRPSMVRALLGWSKQTLDANMAQTNIRLQWDFAKEFLTTHMEELKTLSVSEDAVEYYSGLEDYQNPRFEGLPPRKYFSFLSRGRTYQGKFERLLQHVDRPEWLQIYQDVIRDRDELEILTSLVKQQMEGKESAIADGLWACVQRSFPPPPPTAPDCDGVSKGKESEMNLATYLQQFVLSEMKNFEPQNQEGEQDEQFRILTGVYVVVHQPLKGSFNNMTPEKLKKCPYIIQLPSHADWEGKTSEFDAMVIEHLSDSTTKNNSIYGQRESLPVVRIRQVWEAKASLNPITIRDALTKKGKALESLVHEYLSDAIFMIDGKLFSVVAGGDEKEMPKFGLFGKTLMRSSLASRRFQTTIVEHMLATDAGFVLNEALVHDRVSVPKDNAVKQLQQLVDITRRFDPTLVVNFRDSIESERNKILTI